MLLCNEHGLVQRQADKNYSNAAVGVYHLEELLERDFVMYCHVFILGMQTCEGGGPWSGTQLYAGFCKTAVSLFVVRDSQYLVLVNPDRST